MSTNLAQLVPEAEPRVSRAVPRAPDAFFARVSIRMATAGDRPSLERLAQLDSAPTPSGETLIGELQGRPVVAVALEDGSAIADPLVATAQIVELVRLRAHQLRPQARALRVWPRHRRH